MDLTPRDILLKAPFKRILPNAYNRNWNQFATDGSMRSVAPSDATYEIVTQDDFLREYDPNSHKIHNPNYLMNRIKTDDNGNSYIHYVSRVSMAFQSVITTKRLFHLWGKNIQFINSSPNPTEDQDLLMAEWSNAWLDKNMEEGLFLAGRSEAITGDCAFCGYLDKGKFGYRVFSYLNGETLYPHYSRVTGKLDTFGRRYKAYAQDGVSVVAEYLDVYDDTYITSYKLTNNFVTKIKLFIGFDGWEEIDRKKHGFNFIPIAYKRNELGACWSLSQSNIEQYELSVSNLVENNRAYAFRILFLKGDQIDASVDSSGAPTLITGDKDSEAKFLEKADASSSFDLELKLLRQSIFTSSFSVEPPEITGSDIAGITVKLLYSPAVEKATEDKKLWDMFIDEVVQIFKYGWGIESEKIAQYSLLKIRGNIQVNVHQNDLEVSTILGQSVTMGTLSQKTASGLHPYSVNNEWARIQAEKDAKVIADVKAKDAGSAGGVGNSVQLNENNAAKQAAGV